MINYLGSKRQLLPTLLQLAQASQAKTALDLFSGTNRIAHGFKELGINVTAVDTASYSETFGKTWLELDRERFDLAELAELAEAISYLDALPAAPGFFAEKYSVQSRFFQLENAGRIDAIRSAIEQEFSDTWLYHPLLTSLVLAADRVDSTTGQQAAFLKQWSRRSFQRLTLKDPGLLSGPGRFIRAKAEDLVSDLAEVDLAYLDPPYNQHRYFGNYHIWETLIRWDFPETYGTANKRLDVRHPANKSLFNSKLTMPQALERTVKKLQARVMILSYNNESWLSEEQLRQICEPLGRVEIFTLPTTRYVGSKIGIYNREGSRVGKPGAKLNLEYLAFAGDSDLLGRMLTSLA